MPTSLAMSGVVKPCALESTTCVLLNSIVSSTYVSVPLSILFLTFALKYKFSDTSQYPDAFANLSLKTHCFD